MSRYAISGANTSQITQVVAATSLGTAEDSATSICASVSLWLNTSGKTFYLRGINVLQSASATAERAGVILYDGTAGSTATGSTVKYTVIPATGPNNKQVEFSAPGLKFTLGLMACCNATTQATGAFGPGRVSFYGYEEA